MKRAIYYRLVVLTFVAILICSFISAVIYAVYTENQTKEWLIKLTLSAEANYKHDTDATSLSESAGGNRITIIAPGGKVLADSDADAAGMENHADREEVKYARAGGVYIAMRTSSTLGEKFMYASIKTDDGNVLRLAHSYSGVFSNMAAQIPAILISILVALVLSLFLAEKVSKAITNPLDRFIDALAAGEYEQLGNYKSPYYEIDRIMLSMQSLLQKIADSKERLHSEREKAEYILSNMTEGFVLLDGQKNILMCNNSAREFFSCGTGVELENIYHLTRNITIINAVQLALEEKQSSMFDLKINEGVVNVYVSPSVTAESELGATMLMVDVTAGKLLEEQKRDFFSNASHELKTPITSILGFSEMLSKGMVKDEEEKAAVIGRIETEAKRLSDLVCDILTISKLESNHNYAEYSDFNFSEVVRDAVHSVSPVKDSTTIEVNMDLDDVSVRGDKRQIYELCVNVIDNAFKYNKPNGKVFISLKSESGHAVLTVRDTGVGIPPEYQARVFERFFRVDYGRDKKAGGTGLGLAIVKHIVSIYGGKISLRSEKDDGTTIEISLPIC